MILLRRLIESNTKLSATNSRRPSLTVYVLRFTVLIFTAVGFLLRAHASGVYSNRFGFSGPEIFPIDSQITQLRVADLDGDGLNDLIVVNNARSKITLLYNQTGKTNLLYR